jgi:SAM-dependent methyltransferase
MRENKDLQDFYQKVYLKGEKKHYTHFVTKHTPSSEAEEILKGVNWKSKKVLDVGCGTGNFALKAAKKGAYVLGIDFAEEAIKILKKLKSHLKTNGKIIVTTPNWTNPRGYILMTLWHLFNAPITLADLHYLTPIDHEKWAKKLGMKLKWKTIEKSWAHGEVLINDFKRRIPNVLSDAGLPKNDKNILSLIEWLKNNALKLDNSLPHSGAVGLYVYSKK